MTFEPIRLNRFIAKCGVCSRRAADKLVEQNRVEINGSYVESHGTQVDPSVDVVKVDGKEIRFEEEHVYFIMNKPPDVLTTMNDTHGRPTIKDLLTSVERRVFPVGRLDSDTTGALLLTSDGDLAFQLTHPRYQIPKIYMAYVKGMFTDQAGEKFARGMELEDGAIGRATVIAKHGAGNNTEIKLRLTEGRKREVKQLCQLVGHPVLRLKRLEFAGISADGLKVGQFRELTEAEVSSLKKMMQPSD